MHVCNNVIKEIEEQCNRQNLKRILDFITNYWENYLSLYIVLVLCTSGSSLVKSGGWVGDKILFGSKTLNAET